jgi:hypothetical protein
MLASAISPDPPFDVKPVSMAVIGLESCAVLHSPHIRIQAGKCRITLNLALDQCPDDEFGVIEHLCIDSSASGDPDRTAPLTPLNRTPGGVKGRIQ